MQASILTITKPMLSLMVMALVFMSPNVFAKKDLFANDPTDKSSHQTQQLISTPAVSVADEKPPETITTDTPSETKISPENNKPSYLEGQLQRLKLNIAATKDDLFGKKESKKNAHEKGAPAEATTQNEQVTTGLDTQTATPLISATEAAQKAQKATDGQVMNVRKYQDEDKTRYAVKLLQKNGRMKTVNIDAVTGDVVEDNPL